MTKQYYISAIRLDEKDEHIEFLKIRKANTKESYVVDRGLVAHLINSGLSFKTRYYIKKENKWLTGSEVEVYDGIYLKANPNSTAADNLRNLQVF